MSEEEPLKGKERSFIDEPKWNYVYYKDVVSAVKWLKRRFELDFKDGINRWDKGCICLFLRLI